MNIPAASHADLTLKDGRKVSCKTESQYPYDGAVRITMETAGEYQLDLRIPSWCKKYSVKVNGNAASKIIKRTWSPGDVVELDLEMPISVIRSNPRITGNNGRIALKRGPVVYALEEIDQTAPVRETIIDLNQPFQLISPPEGLPEGTVAIEGKGLREYFKDNDSAYTDAEPLLEEITFRAIPYALWQNRGASNMAVWIRAKSRI